MLKLNYTVASDRGLVRGNNEDSAYAGPHLLILADGMGGHAAGEIASQLMVEHLRVLDADPGDNDMLALLGTVADDANASIAEGVRANPETDGMGTTCTTLLFDGEQFGLLHVGDSRGYRLRDGKLERITRDDTFVQSLVDEGQLDEEDVSTHPQRSLILKAYTGRPVEPTLQILDAQAGDRILLCSDGLSDPVTHTTIESALAEGSVEKAAARLVELALRSGGPDNVTVVIADVVESESYSGPELPTTPVIGGALNGDVPEDPRPDTAAGRAAILRSREPKVIETEEEPEPAKKRPWVLGILLVLAILVGLGVWGYNHMSNNFYVAEKDGNLVIQQGFKFRNSTYQQACIDKDANLKVVDMDTDCSVFKTEDLQPDARSKLANLPEGSYDEIMQQMTTLSKSTLPLCVTRPSEGEQKAGDLTSPGMNCREVH